MPSPRGLVGMKFREGCRRGSLQNVVGSHFNWSRADLPWLCGRLQSLPLGTEPW